MMVVDASVVVSYLVPKDVNHIASRRWFRQQVADERQIIAPLLLLPEIGGAISRRTGNPALSHRAVEALKKLSNLRLIAIDDQLTSAATEYAINLRLRGADALYVAVAARLNLPLVSWDNEHASRAGKVINVMTP